MLCCLVSSSLLSPIPLPLFERNPLSYRPLINRYDVPGFLSPGQGGEAGAGVFDFVDAGVGVLPYLQELAVLL